MPFAIQLYFDENTEALITSAWKELADTEIAPYMYQSTNRPHFTLAIYQDVDLIECEQRLKRFAATKNPLSVALQYLGIFPTTPATVFISAPVTIPLLELHAQIHESLHQIATDSHPYYVPGKWIPHCTLALELEPRLITQVLEVGLKIPMPLHGEMTEIGLIEFRPVQDLFSFPLENRIGQEAEPI
jgi:2'-5' RNA ligase